MDTTKSGSPPCGIYITITDFSDMPRVVKTISEFAFAINTNSPYEKNAHVVELSNASQMPNEIPYASDLIGLIQAKGLIAILGARDKPLEKKEREKGEREKEKNAKAADGIILSDTTHAQPWRAHLGDDHIIGLNAPLESQNANIDFQKTPAEPSIIAKQSATTSPLICADAPTITPQNCAVLAKSGATFMNATNYITTNENGIMQATVNMLDALEKAAEKNPAIN